MPVAENASQNGFEIEHEVRQGLLEGCPYAHFFRQIQCDFDDGVLTLRGSVPTFYLKQVLQTRVMDLPNVAEIHNDVDVVSSSGLSSVH